MRGKIKKFVLIHLALFFPQESSAQYTVNPNGKSILISSDSSRRDDFQVSTKSRENS